MLYEFALIPDIFDAAALHGDGGLRTTLIQILRGIQENGLVANLDKDRWIPHVFERILAAPPALRDKIVACLNILNDRHRLVRHPEFPNGRPKTDEDWLNVARASHGAVPFHGILLGTDLYLKQSPPDDAMLEFSEALDSPLWLSRSRSHSVKKSPAEFRKTFSPVFRHAKTIHILDPYISCFPTYFETVKIVIELAGQRGHRGILPVKIHIHAGDPMRDKTPESVEARMGAWDRKLRPFRSSFPHTYKICLWGSRPGGERFHDRHILTDQCGIEVPGGLDCRLQSQNTTTMFLMDEKDRILRFQNITPATSPYDLLADREIS